jgi:hypothetical protein
MRLIRPEFDEPQLLAWWEPLLVVARKARLADVPWLVAIDEFTFRGRVKRSGKPVLWVYQYSGTGRDVMCTDDGDTYLYKPFANSPSGGRIVACDFDRAMFAAGIPFMPLEPTDYADDDAYNDIGRPARPRARRGAYRPLSHPYLRLL